jgi:uncharacterized membrane protein YphA (DoxX/SURF4 family)
MPHSLKKFFMDHLSREQKIHYTLRLAIGMCFIGHGSFGVITKSVWCNYFEVFGLGHDAAYRLMPLLGSIDILFGIAMLIYPMRAIALWLVVWGTVTALLRPLSGEPFPEFIERAGNFGAPLALLILAGGSKSIDGWLKQIRPDTQPSNTTFKRLEYCLRTIVFLLLCGHGWLNLIYKQAIIDQYSALGFNDPHQVANLVGIFEIVAAFSVLMRPIRWLVFFLLVWKITSELFYPQYEFFEWLERGGSYCSLLALFFVLPSAEEKTVLKKYLLNTIHRAKKISSL